MKPIFSIIISGHIIIVYQNNTVPLAHPVLQFFAFIYQAKMSSGCKHQTWNTYNENILIVKYIYNIYEIQHQLFSIFWATIIKNIFNANMYNACFKVTFCKCWVNIMQLKFSGYCLCCFRMSFLTLLFKSDLILR